VSASPRSIRPPIQAARLHGPGDVRVGLEPAELPGRGEVLLRVTAVGLCGSDLHWYEESSIGDARLSRPLVLGHEFAGVIAGGPRAGERVVADPAWSCGECEPCREGRVNLCLRGRFAGHGTVDGALREAMAWPERLLEPLPDSIGDNEAAILEPLGIALHALDLVPLKPGDRAGVFGCGPIGLLLVQLLKLRGASAIVATDRLPHRVVAARAAGATDAFVVDAEPGNVSAVRRSVREHKVDVAYEASGSDEALADAIESVRPGRRIALVGIPPHDRTSFAAAAARRKELTLFFCRRMVPSDLPRAVELAAGGQVQLARLITHRYPLDRAADAFATLAARSGLKVIVNPSTR
jgi:L-iditol 2-dehydrogenase